MDVWEEYDMFPLDMTNKLRQVKIRTFKEKNRGVQGGAYPPLTAMKTENKFILIFIYSFIDLLKLSLDP